jgi:hypothetical protein
MRQPAFQAGIVTVRQAAEQMPTDRPLVRGVGPMRHRFARGRQVAGSAASLLGARFLRRHERTRRHPAHGRRSRGPQHVLDPLTVLKDAARVVRPGGSDARMCRHIGNIGKRWKSHLPSEWRLENEGMGLSHRTKGC